MIPLLSDLSGAVDVAQAVNFAYLDAIYNTHVAYGADPTTAMLATMVAATAVAERVDEYKENRND